jgi:hypothetical protein
MSSGDAIPGAEGTLDASAPRVAPVGWPAIGAALPDFAIGALFLRTWAAPAPGQERMISYLMLIMLFEFINVHSSAFMGTVIVSPLERGRKTMTLLGLGAFYTLFVGAFSLAFRQAWPLWSFWGLTANRLLGVLIGQAPKGGEALFMRRTWAATVLFYLVFAGITTVLPIPRLGVTPEVMLHFDRMGTGGLWIDQPWRVLAFGFLYFTAVGISELAGHEWLPASSIPRSS